MNKKWLGIIAVVLTVITIGAIAAVIQFQGSSESNKVKIATGNSLLIFTDIAKVYGTYERNGVSISGVLITDARPDILIHSDVDFQLSQSLPYLKAISSGAPVKLVGEVSDKNPIMLVVREDEKDMIKNISDLKGKTVLVLSPGTSPYKIAIQSMKEADLDIEKDINLTSIGKPSPQVVLSMFEKKEADAAFLPPHLIAPIIAKGYGSLLNTTMKSMLNAGIFVRSETIKNNRELVGAFVRGTNETLKIIANNDANEIAKKLLSNPDTKEHYAGYNETSLTIYVKLMKSVLSDNVTISEKDFTNIVNFARDILRGKVSFEDTCDTSFAGKR